MLHGPGAVRRDSELNENGESYIPASQRPDGTWRKARRVKEGYVPQEEVPLYESKGKKFLSKQQTPAEPLKIDGMTSHKTIPGLFIEDKVKTGKSKKKVKKVEEVTNEIAKVKISEAPSPQAKVENKAASDPAKKLKNLKKRLREVEALEQKIKSGEISKPEPEQLTKIKRRGELLLQIHELEKEV